MSARQFLQQLNQVKDKVRSGEAPPEIGEGLQALLGRFKDVYSQEEFKAALEADAEIDSGLEEGMTTLYMTWRQTL